MKRVLIAFIALATTSVLHASDGIEEQLDLLQIEVAESICFSSAFTLAHAVSSDECLKMVRKAFGQCTLDLKLHEKGISGRTKGQRMTREEFIASYAECLKSTMDSSEGQ